MEAKSSKTTFSEPTSSFVTICTVAAWIKTVQSPDILLLLVLKVLLLKDDVAENEEYKKQGSSRKISRWQITRLKTKKEKWMDVGVWGAEKNPQTKQICTGKRMNKMSSKEVQLEEKKRKKKKKQENNKNKCTKKNTKKSSHIFSLSKGSLVWGGRTEKKKREKEQ